MLQYLDKIVAEDAGQSLSLGIANENAVGILRDSTRAQLIRSTKLRSYENRKQHKSKSINQMEYVN